MRHFGYTALGVLAAALLSSSIPASADGPAPPARPEAAPDVAGGATRAEIDRLVEALGADAYAERERASERLAAIGKPAHDALRRALASKDAEVRYRARLILRAPLRKVALLLQDVGRRGSAGDEGAQKALVAMGEEAIDPLILVIRRDLVDFQPPGDDERLRVAFQALQEIGASGPGHEARAKVVRAVLLSLLELNLHNVDGRAASALRALGEDEARAALVERLRAPAALSRRNAIHILGIMGGPATVRAVAVALEDGEGGVRVAAIDALLEATRGATEGAAAAKAAAAEAILGRLADPEKQVEMRAIEALGELRAKAALEHLRKLVSAGSGVAEDDPRLGAAVTALGLLEDKESIPAITALLRSSRSELVGRAADAAGALKAREAVPALLACLDHEQAAAIVKSLRALGRIGDERAFDPLRTFYLQKPIYRQPALLAIARLEGAKPLAFLVERAKAAEDEFEVRLALAAVSRRGGSTPEGRAQVGEAALAALARQPVDLRRFALRLIARTRYAPAYEAVERLLSSTDTRLATEAAETVAAMGDKRAVKTLRELVKSQNEEVTRAAIVALARLGDPEPLQKAVAEAEAAVARSPDSPTDRFQLGLYYLYAKDNVRGAAEFEKILEKNPQNYVAAYNLACAKSLLGEKAAAIEALKSSVELGFHDWLHMEQDDDLDNIRATPEMKEIMTRLRKEEPNSDMPRLAIGGAFVRELDELGALDGVVDEGDEK